MSKAQYVQRLDLGEDPFSADYSGSFFYTGASRRQLLDQITHLSRFGDHVVIVTGTIGSGKSTLLDATISRLQSLMDCCYIDAQLENSPEQILESVSQQLRFHLTPPIGIADFLLELEACTSSEVEPEPILLAIDQAHYLEIEGLECLLALFNQGRGVIRVCLVGEYQVQQMAQLAGFVNERTKVLELPALTLSEVDEYILAVLRSVGYAGNQPLSSDQLAVLHEQSSGNIGEINRLVPQLLLGEVHTASKPQGLTIPKAHIAAIAALLLALLASFLYQGDDVEQRSAQRTTVSLPANRAPVVATINESLKASSESIGQLPALGPADSIDSSAVDKEQGDISAQGVSELPDASPAQTGRKSEVVDIKPAALSPEVKLPGQPSVTPQPVPVESIAALQADQIKPPADRETSVESDEVSAPTRQNSLPMDSPLLRKPALHSSQTSNSNKPLATTKKPKESTSSGQASVMQLPETAYMLQLLGTVEEQRAKEFVKRYKGQVTMSYVALRRQSKPWYIVLTGPYDNRDKAAAAVKSLPASLRQQKPWPKSVGSIQKNLQKTK